MSHGSRPRVFLGITGASGAPYAARILEGLAAAGADVGVCASEAAGEVIGWEVYRERVEPGDGPAVVERFVREHGGDGATLYGERDWFSPYASGSARCDAYIICPCSMATVGTIASSGQANLIHRAAGVALKEDRRLVVVPRETPLSVIHLQQLLVLRQAGALVAPAMPAFYTQPDTLDDAVDFVAGKVLDLAGIEHRLLKRWSEPA
jgi:4-hydroxy-3-polyprenylbenzoate decarboxylase